MAHPLARVTSDHIPIHIQIGSDIPKSSIFRFENYWLEFDGFYETVIQCWNRNQQLTNSAKDTAARFKCLRMGLKKWSKNLSKLNTNISACNYVLSMIDGIEDQRNLSTIEANFRTIIKNHIAKLLEVKRIYWKSRFKMMSIQLDDENTEFFHAMATQSYMKNFITTINDEDGNPFQNHDHKAVVVWKSYKDRLGKAIDPPMLFNLEEIIQPKDLSELDAPFSMDEIDQVIKDIHSDRAPGPDGFNGLFLKKCWDIIK